MHFPLHGKKKALPLHSQLSNCPDGGIGRRAGLKHQWGNPSRFDPGSGYAEILVEHIYEDFSFFKTSKLVTFGHHIEKGGSTGRNKGQFERIWHKWTWIGKK